MNAQPSKKAQTNSQVAKYWFKFIVHPKMPFQTYMIFLYDVVHNLIMLGYVIFCHSVIFLYPHISTNLNTE